MWLCVIYRESLLIWDCSFILVIEMKWFCIVSASKQRSMCVYKNACNDVKLMRKKTLTRRLPLDRRSVVDADWLVDCIPAGPVMGTTEPPVLMPWPNVALNHRFRARKREIENREEKNVFTENIEHQTLLKRMNNKDVWLKRKWRTKTVCNANWLLKIECRL